MMSGQCYLVEKEARTGDVVHFDWNRLQEGFQITPKNQLRYDGILVNQLIIVKHTFIEKLLKKKIQKKLEIYLNYIVDVIDEEDDSTSSGALAEILDELSRYKDILRYRYAKYLGEKYVDLLMKKIDLLEYELKLKVMQVRQLEYMYEDEMKNTRNR